MAGKLRPDGAPHFSAFTTVLPQTVKFLQFRWRLGMGAFTLCSHLAGQRHG
jgi:hypothetical protein